MTNSFDFSEPTVRRIAFTNSREQAEEITEKEGLYIFYPSPMVDFGLEEEFYVLIDYPKEEERRRDGKTI